MVMHKYDLELERFLVVRLFIIIGTFSYSLYLLHIPLWTLAGMLAKTLIPFLGNQAQPPVVIAIAIVLSFIWYLFFEKPSSQTGVLKCLASPINTVTLGIDSARGAIFGERKVSKVQGGIHLSAE